jgi:hypothetical protein
MSDRDPARALLMAILDALIAKDASCASGRQAID